LIRNIECRAQNCIAVPEYEKGTAIGPDALQWFSETAVPSYAPKEPLVKTRIIYTTDYRYGNISMELNWFRATGFLPGVSYSF
jgi:hypothetical protein